MSKPLNLSRFFRPTVDSTVANIVDKASRAEPRKANIEDANCINENNVENNILVATKLNQPGKYYSFKMREFGRHRKIERHAFQHSWFDDHKWLHYDKNLDAAFCFTCLEAVKCNAISSKTLEKAFITEGFTDWKHVKEKPSKNQLKDKGIYKHKLSECHREAVERVITIPSQVEGSIDELFASPKVLNEQKKNREILRLFLIYAIFISLTYYAQIKSDVCRSGWKKGMERDINLRVPTFKPKYWR